MLAEIENEFPKATTRTIPPKLKLAATLRFLAEGSYQKSIGQDFHLGMAQTTVSKILEETLKILENKLCTKWISMVMTEEEKKTIKMGFHKITGFPGVIGCVDGTHIKIIKPKYNEHIYYNRKGYHSVNAMVVSNFKYFV